MSAVMFLLHNERLVTTFCLFALRFETKTENLPLQIVNELLVIGPKKVEGYNGKPSSSKKTVFHSKVKYLGRENR